MKADPTVFDVGRNKKWKLNQAGLPTLPSTPTPCTLANTWGRTRIFQRKLSLGTFVDTTGQLGAGAVIYALDSGLDSFDTLLTSGIDSTHPIFDSPTGRQRILKGYDVVNNISNVIPKDDIGHG